MTISLDAKLTPLYAQVTHWGNLWLAFQRAAQGKRGLAPAATFEWQLADNLLDLQRDLMTFQYRPGPYRSFYIHEPKRRLISAAPFRDRVVHHALCNMIEPLFERRFYPGSYANRVGKGTHRAVDALQAASRCYRYVLRLDIVQHFPSVDHAILRTELARVIGDEQVLWLVDQILASGAGVLSDAYDMVWFPGDDLLAPLRPRGLPIGNLTSQFWSNCYLNSLDWYIKRTLRCPVYLRYVDDLALFSDSKAELWAWKRAIVDRLAALRLTIHEGPAQVTPVTQGIPWLGWVVYPNHRRLKRRNVINVRRRLKYKLADYRAGRLAADALRTSIHGWINHARYGDTWGLRRAVLKKIRLPPPRHRR